MSNPLREKYTHGSSQSEQHAFLLNCYGLVSADEAYNQLKHQFAFWTISQSTFKRWWNKFSSGDFTLTPVGSMLLIVSFLKMHRI